LISSVEGLLRSGEFFNWVLVGIALEAVALIAWRGRAILQAVLPNLIAGAALMFCVKLAITDAQWQWLAFALTVALLAHGIDLLQRVHGTP